jgi:hypothetical protein
MKNRVQHHQKQTQALTDRTSDVGDDTARVSFAPKNALASNPAPMQRRANQRFMM